MPLSGRIQVIRTEVAKLKSRVYDLQIHVGMDHVEEVQFPVLGESLTGSSQKVRNSTAARQLPVETEQVPQADDENEDEEEEWSSEQSEAIETTMMPAYAQTEQSSSETQASIQSAAAQEQGSPAPAPMALEEQARQASKQKRPRARAERRHKAPAGRSPRRKSDEGDDDDEEGVSVDTEGLEAVEDLERTAKPSAKKRTARTHRPFEGAASLLDLSSKGLGKKRRVESLKSQTEAAETEVAALWHTVQSLENEVAPDLSYSDDAALLARGAHKTKSKSSAVQSMQSRIVMLERDVDDLRTHVSSLEHTVMG